MSTRRSYSRFPTQLLIGAMIAPLFIYSIGSADRPAPIDVRDLPAPAGQALVGYGKGQLSMPVVSKDGRMFGVLADPDCNELFQLEAMLSGCMPNVPFSVDAYTFGGLYGKIRKLVDANPEFQPRSVLFYVEGTWLLDERAHGSFGAVVYKELDSGRRVVAGKMYGEFSLGTIQSLALTVPVDDVAVGGKAVKVPFVDARRLTDPYGDAKRPTKGGKVAVDDVRGARAGDALGDAKTAPRKGGGKLPVDDIRKKHVSDPFGDGKSVPRKGGGKTPFGESADEITEPTLGSFVLRYVFLR